jgi:tetratricopeptide (TPR) repeat protein
MPRPAAQMGSADDLLDFSDLNASAPEPKTSPRSLAPLPATLARPPAGQMTPRPMPAAPPPPPARTSAPQSSAPFDFSVDFDPAPPLDAGLSASGRLTQPTPSGLDFDSAAQVSPPTAVVNIGSKCKSCGKALTDPFDQALGTCDDCRSAVSNPLSMDDSLGRPSAGAQPLGRMAAAPAAKASAPAPELAKPQAKRSAGRDIQSAYRDGEVPSGGSGKVVVIALVAVAVIGGGGWLLYTKRPWVKKPPPLAQKLPIAAARPIEAMVDRWKDGYGKNLTGSAAEHLAAGEEKLALDTARAYGEAEEEFKKALVLDKNNDRAVAGWALALAFGRGEKADAETLKMAEQMLVSAEQRGGDARVYAAHAHLMLVRGANINDVKAQAERGLSSPSDKDKALGYLALAQGYVAQNTKLAEENLKEALKADPKLKRAYLFQVRLMVSNGDFRGAATGLEKRLEGDPDQFEASDALAKLYIEMGDVAAGKRTYYRALQAAPKDPRAKLALGVIAYQHENDLSAAADRFDALYNERASLDAGLRVDLFGHRAALKRLQGDLNGANDMADQAIALKADDVNAHLQKLFVALSLANATDARTQLPFVKLGDDAMDAAVEARVLLLEDKADAALALLLKAIDKDPRRVDATILAGAAAVKAHNEPKGWELALGKTLRADPLQTGPRPPMAPYFTRPGDFIAPARGVFSKLGKDPEDPNPHYAEGAMAWHAGELGSADQAFSAVLAADPTNAMALAYRALIAIRKRDYPGAMKHATKAVAADRSLGLALYALGSAQFLTGKVEQARATLRDATERDPKLLCAKARLAEADIKVKKVPAAKTALITILSVDPSYTEAKRVLYGMPQ